MLITGAWKRLHSGIFWWIHRWEARPHWKARDLYSSQQYSSTITLILSQIYLHLHTTIAELFKFWPHPHPHPTKLRQLRPPCTPRHLFLTVVDSMKYIVGYNLSPIFTCLYLFRFWQFGTIKNMPNWLSAVPVCSVLTRSVLVVWLLNRFMDIFLWLTFEKMSFWYKHYIHFPPESALFQYSEKLQNWCTVSILTL